MLFVHTFDLNVVLAYYFKYVFNQFINSSEAQITPFIVTTTKFILRFQFNHCHITVKIYSVSHITSAQVTGAGPSSRRLAAAGAPPRQHVRGGHPHYAVIPRCNSNVMQCHLKSFSVTNMAHNVGSLVILSEPLCSLAMTLHSSHCNSLRFV